MSNKIQSTTNYSRFKFINGNRPVHKRVRQLIKSIKKKNLLANYPIVVTKERDGRLGICDGQHRYTAAMELGIPIYFVEAKNISLGDVAMTNSAQKGWTPTDFIASYAAQGNKDYIELQSFIKEFGLPPSTSAGLLSGRLLKIGQSDRSATVSSGQFKVQSVQFARKVADTLRAIAPLYKSVKDNRFVLAIAHLIKTPEFSIDRFLTKLEYQSTRLVKCADWHQYVNLIDEIYNYKVRASEVVSLPVAVRKATTK